MEPVPLRVSWQLKYRYVQRRTPVNIKASATTVNRQCGMLRGAYAHVLMLCRSCAASAPKLISCGRSGPSITLYDRLPSWLAPAGGGGCMRRRMSADMNRLTVCGRRSGSEWNTCAMVHS